MDLEDEAPWARRLEGVTLTVQFGQLAEGLTTSGDRERTEGHAEDLTRVSVERSVGDPVMGIGDPLHH